GVRGDAWRRRLYVGQPVPHGARADPRPQDGRRELDDDDRCGLAGADAPGRTGSPGMSEGVRGRIQDTIRQCVDRHGARTALADGTSALSYCEFADRIAAASDVLR